MTGLQSRNNVFKTCSKSIHTMRKSDAFQNSHKSHQIFELFLSEICHSEQIFINRLI